MITVIGTLGACAMLGLRAGSLRRFMTALAMLVLFLIATAIIRLLGGAG